VLLSDAAARAAAPWTALEALGAVSDVRAAAASPSSNGLALLLGAIGLSLLAVASSALLRSLLRMNEELWGAK
jgi:hypothetical protein